jgi:hypothetical protein
MGKSASFWAQRPNQHNTLFAGPAPLESLPKEEFTYCSTRDANIRVLRQPLCLPTTRQMDGWFCIWMTERKIQIQITLRKAKVKEANCIIQTLNGSMHSIIASAAKQCRDIITTICKFASFWAQRRIFQIAFPFQLQTGMRRLRS